MALRTVALRFLIVFFMSFDVPADDILSQLFKTEEQLAESGNAAAMYILGTMYEEGTGVDQSDERAMEWYRKAAARGNREAEAKLFNVNIKRGTTPTKADSASKATIYERARANALELKLARERQAAEKARQEAEELKADTAARVRLIEEQRTHDRAEADKAKEAGEKARRLVEKTNLLNEQLKREKAEAESARAEAEKLRLEAENARLLGERLARDRGQAPNSPSGGDTTADPADNAAATTHFKANPCETAAARFMSTCQ
jgi:hypothetical protein